MRISLLIPAMVWLAAAASAAPQQEVTSAPPVATVSPSVHPQESETKTAEPRPAVEEAPSSYILGPGDQIVIRAFDAEEISDKPTRISSSGYINLPLVGRVHAAGMTVEQLEAELTSRLQTYIQSPEVSVSVSEFRSQPVSVIGAVNAPGVHQLQGHKTLIEILSLAGGTRSDAGHTVKITRRLEWGRIPLPNAKDDPTGQFSVAEVNLKSVLDAKNPQDNILIQPEDVISVPRAEMVYVVGDVPRAGGFVLNEQENVTVLQALSLAGGLGRAAAPTKAKLLRAAGKGANRTELAVNLKDILAGKKDDIPMQPEDILFIPNSASKSVALRSLETALGMGAQIGAGVAIYSH